MAKRLAERGVRHLWLTGCGDSAFAGLAAALAFQRHTPVTAHPVHALDLARYQVRGLPAGSAVIATVVLGQGRPDDRGGDPGAAGRPPRDRADQLPPTAAGPGQSDEVLPVDVPTLGFSPGTSTYVAMLGTLLRLAGELAELRGDGGDLAPRLAGCPARSRRRCGGPPTPLRQRPALLLSAPWTAFLGAGPERGDGAVRRREADRGRAAARRRHQPRGVGARGVLRDLGRRPGRPDQPERRRSRPRHWRSCPSCAFIGARPVVISDSPPARRRRRATLLLPLARRGARGALAGHRVPAARAGRLPPRQAGRQAVVQLPRAPRPGTSTTRPSTGSTVGEPSVIRAEGGRPLVTG